MAENSGAAEPSESGESAPNTVRSEQPPRCEAQPEQPQQQEIGNQTGIACRAPTFGSDGLSESQLLATGSSKASPEYLGVSSLTYFADEFNRSFLSDSKGILSAAADKIGYSGSIGFSITGELGMVPILIGLGPYANASGNVGFTSEGRFFIQAQLSLGVGIGTFYGAGPSFQGTRGVNPEVGFDGALSVQVVGNAGLGESGGFQFQIPDDVNWARGLSIPKLLPARFGLGRGAQIAIAPTFTGTATFPNWNDFVTGGGRLIQEAEVQLYQSSRMMEWFEDR
jgi:hypothetical protein